jgi:hypothetical protein
LRQFTQWKFGALMRGITRFAAFATVFGVVRRPPGGKTEWTAVPD